MINPSSFLRRALLADAVFSGVAALGFTFGAGAFNPVVFVAVAAVLAIVVIAAFAGPARRALAVDLVRSLRAD